MFSFGFCGSDNILTKSNLGRKEFISSCTLQPIIGKKVRARSQGRNLVAGTEGQAMKEYCLPVCPPCLAQLLFLNAYQTTCSVGSTVHSQPWIIKNPADLPTGQTDAGSSLIEVFSSGVTVVCIKLMKTNQHSIEELIPYLSPCSCIYEGRKNCEGAFLRKACLLMCVGILSFGSNVSKKYPNVFKPFYPGKK